MNQTEKDKLDERLKQLALVAQQHSPLTQQRQLALGQLMQAILKSGRLCRPQLGKFASRYEEIYEEARQELLLYICRNIEKYDLERGEVMAWCNVLLERRFFRDAISKVLGKPEIQKMTLADLDNLPSPEEDEPIITEIIEAYITSDPENLFKNIHIRNHPEANFQALAKQRLEGKSWQNISEKFELKIPTISQFYYRCLKKFALTLQKAVGIIELNIE